MKSLAAITAKTTTVKDGTKETSMQGDQSPLQTM